MYSIETIETYVAYVSMVPLILFPIPLNCSSWLCLSFFAFLGAGGWEDSAIASTSIQVKI